MWFLRGKQNEEHRMTQPVRPLNSFLVFTARVFKQWWEVSMITILPAGYISYNIHSPLFNRNITFEAI